MLIMAFTVQYGIYHNKKFYEQMKPLTTALLLVLNFLLMCMNFFNGRLRLWKPHPS